MGTGALLAQAEPPKMPMKRKQDLWNDTAYWNTNTILAESLDFNIHWIITPSHSLFYSVLNWFIFPIRYIKARKTAKWNFHGVLPFYRFLFIVCIYILISSPEFGCGPGKSHIVGTKCFHKDSRTWNVWPCGNFFLMGFRVRSGNIIYCFLQYKNHYVNGRSP